MSDENQNPRPIFLTFAGAINQEAANRLFGIFAGAMRDGFTDFHLLIQSGGGFIGDGVAVHNFILGIPVHVTTYNVGSVASIAVPVYLAGAHRVAAENSTFMIHRPHNMSVGGPANVVAAAASSLGIDENRCQEILKSKLSLKTKEWTLYAKSDLTFTAADGMENGAVHEIGLFAPSRGAPIYNV